MINVAQIGVGYWGPNLLRNLNTNKNINIKKIVEVDSLRIKFINNNFPQIQVTKNFDEVLNDKTIDAIVIATPAKTHFELGLQSLNAKKHILVEKPIATSVENTKKIFLTAEKNNLIAMSGHTFLYNSAVRYIKKIIDSGELGEIIYIFSQRLNLGRVRSDINSLWNLAPHDISIIQYWLDNKKHNYINYNGVSYIQKGIDDIGFLNIKYPGNILANIHVGWLCPNKIRKITLVGSKKMLEYDDIAEKKISIFDKGIDIVHNLKANMEFDKNKYDIKYRSKVAVNPNIRYEEPLKIEIEHFVDCIVNKTNCITGKNHSINVIKILEEACPI